MRFMEFATIEQTLIEDRDEYARLADAALSAGQMDVFHMHARKFHEIASAVGYPDVD